MSSAPSPELADELKIITNLSDRVTHGDATWSAKYGRSDQARKSRKRGRRNPED